MLRYLTPFLVFSTPAIADPGDRWQMMNWGYGMGMMFGPVLWLIIIGLIVAGIVWIVRKGETTTSAERDLAYRSSALDLLDMRLAKGEIDAEEYKTRRSLLVGE